MQGGGVKVRAVRPNQRVNFRVKPDLIEEGQVPQRPVERPGQNRLKADGLLRLVIKPDVQGIRRNDFKGLDTIEGCIDFHIHTNDDSEEPTEFWHKGIIR